MSEEQGFAKAEAMQELIPTFDPSTHMGNLTCFYNLAL